MNRVQILVIEDDIAVGNLITTTLEMENYQFRLAKTAKQGIMNVLSYNPDIMLLDLGLPDMDGLEVIKKVRSWSNIPIIVVSARSEDQDKVKALDLGADDYLIKPFAFEELLARIRVMMRRKPQFVTNQLKIADLTLDRDTRIVTRAGKEISLSSKEFMVLECLMRNQNIVMTRQQIEQNAWNYDYEGGSNVIDVYIRYLRKKIDAGYEKKLIHTVRGTDYVMREE